VAAADSLLSPSSKNLNDGANSALVLDTHRVVVAFDLTGVSAAGLSRVTLRLTLAEPATNWGSKGRFVSVHRLALPFAEGNGRWFGLSSSDRTRGNGLGVTWNCAIDGQIANTIEDCAALWNGGSTAAGPASASVLHTNGLTGAVEWDVTADVLEAKDGAAALGNPEVAPTLRFEF